MPPVMKRSKTSFLWNFFTELDESFAKCNMCRAKLSYKTSTSNLKKHVEIKHPTVCLVSSRDARYSEPDNGDNRSPSETVNEQIKQSPSNSPHRQSSPERRSRDDNDDDFQSLPAKNSSNEQDDYNIFGAFVASELRAMGNNIRLIRSVKRKIQVAILETYETETSNTFDNTCLPSASNVPKPLQLSCSDTAHIKNECDDDPDSIFSAE